MAINVEALSNYVEQKRLPLIAKSFLTGKTVDLVMLETGIRQDMARVGIGFDHNSSHNNYSSLVRI